MLSLVIVGDVTAARAPDRAAAELAGLVVGRRRRSRALPVRRALDGGARPLIDVPGKSQTDIAYGFVTIRRLDPRYYAYWLMNNVLGQFGLGGRLGDNIRERQGMAYYAYSAIDPSLGEGPLVIRAGVDPANVERALAAIDHEVRALGRDGPTAAELAQSQQYTDRIDSAQLETNAGIASFLAHVGAVRPRPRLRSPPARAPASRDPRRSRRRRARAPRSGAGGGRNRRPALPAERWPYGRYSSTSTSR